MVVAFSLNKKSLADHQPILHTLDDKLAQAVRSFQEASDKDAAALTALAEAWKRPNTDPDKPALLADCTKAAIKAPRHTLELCINTLNLLDTLEPICNRMLISDVAVSAVLAEAAAAAAAINIRINLPTLEDRAEAARIESETAALTQSATTRRADLERRCAPEPNDPL